jgi:hypothetical protein
MPEEWQEFVLCREFGWTHDQYLDQPGHLNDWFLAFLDAEGRARRRAHG